MYAITVIASVIILVYRVMKVYEMNYELGTREGSESIRAQMAALGFLCPALFYAIAMGFSDCAARRVDKFKAVGIFFVIQAGLTIVVMVYQLLLMKAFFSASSTIISKFLIRAVGGYLATAECMRAAAVTLSVKF